MASETYERPSISIDLLPTFMTAAGEPLSEEFSGEDKRQKAKRTYDGVNLLPFLNATKDGKDDQYPHRDLFWRMALRGAAVRSGDWKLIVNVHTQPMLFDLSADHSEQNNLYRNSPSEPKNCGTN